ncbi:MAG TPA: methyltransferase domain-containing protein [Planctomycetota bacterium]|nr:methyltransferase domain-containing protein [Planctomycetota bacterium]
MAERPAARSSSYVHGAEPSEQQRLGWMNAILNPRHLAAIGAIEGARGLELGAGTGLFAAELARAVGPRGQVVAVERDARQLERAREHAAGLPLELRAGDVFALPLAAHEWGSFDLVHARFLLEHVPDPQAVVDGMLRAARPGGRIVLADDDHDVLRLHPAAPRVERLWRAYLETYTRAGNDPFVGRRLVELLARAGARPRRNDWLFFGSCVGARDFDSVLDNLAGILRGARAAIAAGLSEGEQDAGLDELERWRARDDAAVWFALCWAEGERPR